MAPEVNIVQKLYLALKILKNSHNNKNKKVYLIAKTQEKPKKRKIKHKNKLALTIISVIKRANSPTRILFQFHSSMMKFLKRSTESGEVRS